MAMDIFQQIIRKLKIGSNEDIGYTERKQKYENIMSFAETVILNDISVKGDLHPHEREYYIFYVIKILTDKIVNDNVLNVISSNSGCKEDGRKYQMIINLMVENNNTSAFSLFKTLIDKAPNNNNKIIVNLSTAPIITEVWKSDKLVSLLKLGTEEEPWKFISDKHMANIYLPIGLSLITDNGNHSIYIGILKNTGNITIDSEHIYNIENLLNYITFDGTYYRKQSDNSIICKAFNFEFGCILAIGKLILKYQIDYRINNQQYQ